MEKGLTLVVLTIPLIILLPRLDGNVICERPLGMKDGSITDEQITASSYFHKVYAPWKGRLNSDGYWQADSRSQFEYFRIDLRKVSNVTSIALQGAKYFTKTFHVYYSLEGVVWSAYRSSPSSPLLGDNLQGNEESLEMVIRVFSFPIKTRYIMINPTSWHKVIALKIELYGCVLADQSVNDITNLTDTQNFNDTQVLSEGIYLIRNMLYIEENGKLVLEPGVHLVFMEEDAGIHVKTCGRLLANGSAEKPVIFTSHYPFLFHSREKWRGIKVETGGTLELRYSDVRQADVGVQGPSDSISLQNSSIYLCDYGVYATSGSAYQNHSFIQTSRISHNNECGLKLVSTPLAPYISVADSEISHNHDHGIYFEQHYTIVPPFTGLQTIFRNVSILNNKAYGIHRSQNGKIDIIDSTILDNHAGGLNIAGNKISLNIFSSNFANNGNDDIVLHVDDLHLVVMDSSFMPSVEAAMKLFCSSGNNHQPWFIDVRNNTFQNSNQYSDGLIEIYSSKNSQVFIEHNVFSGSFNGVYFESPYKYFQFSPNVHLQLNWNTFHNITDSYAVKVAGVESNLTMNTFRDCSVDAVVVLASGYSHKINFNTFHNPRSELDLRVSAPFNDSISINATHNFFTPVLARNISSRLCGHACQKDKSRVDIFPYYFAIHPNITVTPEPTSGVPLEEGDFSVGRIQKNEVIKSGSYIVPTETIIVPKEYSLRIEGNTVFQFKPGTGIQVFGSLETGVTEGPVVFRSSSGIGDGHWDGIAADGADISLRNTLITDAIAAVTLNDESLSPVGRCELHNVTISKCFKAITGAFSRLHLKSCHFQNNSHGILWNSLEKVLPPVNISIVNSSFVKNKNAVLKVDAEKESELNISVVIVQSSFIQNQNPSVFSGQRLSYSDIIISHCSSRVFFMMKECVFRESNARRAVVILKTELLSAEVQGNQFQQNTNGLNFHICGRLQNTSYPAMHITVDSNNFNNTKLNEDLIITSGEKFNEEDIDVFVHNILVTRNSFFKSHQTINEKFGFRFHMVSFQGFHDVTIDSNHFISKSDTAIGLEGAFGKVFICNNVIPESCNNLFLETKKTNFLDAPVHIYNNTFNTTSSCYKNIIIDSRDGRIALFTNNTFYTQLLCFIMIKSSNISIRYNYFSNPEVLYFIKYAKELRNYEHLNDQVVDASYNYWGTTIIADIRGKFSDFSKTDNPDIIFMPILLSPNPENVFEQRSPFFQVDQEIGGVISSFVLLTKHGSPYCAVSHIEIRSEGSLTIEAGVKIFFQKDIGIEVNGTLMVLGERSFPVELVSFKKGSRWRGVEFSESSNFTSQSVLMNMNLFGTWNGLVVRGNTTLKSVTSKDSNGSGITFDLPYLINRYGDVGLSLPSLVTTGNKKHGIYLNGSSLAQPVSLIFTDCNIINNSLDGVHIEGKGNITFLESFFIDVIYLYRSSWIITRNSFTSSDAYGIMIKTWAGHSDHQIVIDDNIFRHISTRAVYVYNEYTDTLLTLSLQRNLFENNTGYSWGQKPVVYIRYNSRTEGMLAVHHNKVYNCTAGKAIHISGYQSIILSNVTISHNRIMDNVVQKGFVFRIYAREFHHNILHNPAAKLEFCGPVYDPLATLNATHNYWGSGDLWEILQRMQFFETHLFYGFVRYLPCLKSPYTEELAEWKQDMFEQLDVLGGEIFGEVMLKKNDPYVIQRSIMIRKGGRLIIESGTTLQFHEYRGIFVEGSLIVLSSESEETIFKKYPGKNRYTTWYGIIFFGNTTDGSESVLSNTRILETWAAVTINSPCLQMSNCTIYEPVRNCIEVKSNVKKIDLKGTTLIGCEDSGIRIVGDFDELFVSGVQITRAGFAGIYARLGNGTVVLTDVIVKQCPGESRRTKLWY
ncbi:hypothetical protein ScPMuIL_008746 [Solemya velum]